MSQKQRRSGPGQRSEANAKQESPGIDKKLDGPNRPAT